MLSYLHAFHAGNFADVQKHFGLLMALRLMQGKPSPIACFDTHAGSADYALDSEEARKTGEASHGIDAISACRRRLSANPDWAEWFALVDQDLTIRRYPGSPAWFARLARAEDRVTAFELHPREGGALEQWARGRRVKVLREDGLAGLVRLLPPQAPRLCVLMDPSYEVRAEYARVAQTLIEAWGRCRHGVFLIWYPILADAPHRALCDALQASSVHKVLQSEVRLQVPPVRGMLGSGLLVVNPPWHWDARMEAAMTSAREAGWGIDHRLGWLIPE